MKVIRIRPPEGGLSFSMAAYHAIKKEKENMPKYKRV